MIDATQIRRGMIIVMNGQLFRVMEMQLITPGRWKAMVQTKLRNIKEGSQMEYRFRSEERVDQAYLEEIEMEFLYQQAGEYFFMNLETYETIRLEAEAIGDGVGFLMPNIVIKVVMYDGKPVGVTLPNSADMKVVTTEPSLRGATVSAVNKPAIMETGIVISVPQFIKEGDVIRVDTRENKYIERVKSK
jgi:elongation factor P